MSRGVDSGFTLFLVFIAVLVSIGLLFDNGARLLLPIFGIALGLLVKPRNVNVIIEIALWTISIFAVGYLFFWFITNILPIVYMSFWLILYSPAILLVVIGCYFIRLRKSKSTNANIGVVLMIIGIGTLLYLCWWFLTTEWFITSVLPILLLIPIGFFAAILFPAQKKPKSQTNFTHG